VMPLPKQSLSSVQAGETRTWAAEEQTDGSIDRLKNPTVVQISL